MEKTKKKVIEYCNKCKIHTSHDINAENLEIEGMQDNYSSSEFGRTLFQILECNKCPKCTQEKQNSSSKSTQIISTKKS